MRSVFSTALVVLFRVCMESNAEYRACIQRALTGKSLTEPPLHLQINPAIQPSSLTGNPECCTLTILRRVVISYATCA